MKITSTAFEDKGEIPKQYTCDGENLIIPLSFEDVPAEAKSLVLIVDDPDAPVGLWTHWVVFNISADAKGVGEKAPGVQGKNSWQKAEWGGPCPPDREHRYFFRLYALDTELSLEEGALRKDVEAAMEGHILEKAELMGRYKRPGM